MSDTSLPVIVRFDTTANRTAFTPTPGVPEQLYIWLDSDDQPNAYYWDGAAWQPFNADTTGITQLTGDVTAGPGSGSVAATIANDAITTVKILNSNVTYAKIQNVSATDRLLLRDTAGAGVIEEGIVANGIEFSGAPGIRQTAAARTRSVAVVIDGGGSAITTGVKVDFRFPVAGTIIRNTLLADQAGSIVIDIWKDVFANYPPTVADTITAAAKPTLSAAQASEDSTLTGWTTAIAAGDTFRINVDSAATITRVTLVLDIVVDG